MIEPTAEQPEVEDSGVDDGASSDAGSSVQDSLASLRSSILDYRRENGRTYHSMSDGKYCFPNDEREQDRLDLMHHLWGLTWDGDLCISPKKNGAKRVLDIGTGTGIWALDFADEHPEATVMGVDLSPIQPSFVPPNCSFEVDDVEKEWTWSMPFDFIFVRSMVASFEDWPAFVAKAYDNLEPGGYLEFQDMMFPVKCDDGTMPDDRPYGKWIKLLNEGCELNGRTAGIAASFKKMLEDAGFVDVVERKAKWPITPWTQDPKLRELGFWCRASALQGAEAITLGLFTRVLGWTMAEATVLCADVRKDLKKNDIHGYFEIYAAYGRKPEEGEENSQPQQ